MEQRSVRAAFTQVLTLILLQNKELSQAATSWLLGQPRFDACRETIIPLVEDHMDQMYVENSIHCAQTQAHGPNACGKQHTLAQTQAHGPNVCGKQHTLCPNAGDGPNVSEKQHTFANVRVSRIGSAISRLNSGVDGTIM
ncbi:hypothetical protein [Paenibacillus sp. FSL R7-0179]|uniref:hypothetical protein n=1 Tax=Paenibacillus sp. FSL R7-0179 TaxID=2921672 RepID=UPI0030F558F0